jgi:hypothetical protein
MLSSEENPGIFTFLVGMIVLVMAAVGLSVMMDKKLSFSGRSRMIEEEIAGYAGEVAELNARKEVDGKTLVESQAKLQLGSKTHREVTALLGTFQQRKTSLENARSELQSAIERLDADFSRYRAEYRRKTWAAAVGENLGDLAVRGGRGFAQATITRVTDVGLEIRHQHGIARIQAPDLDPKFQDRFQWSDEERRNRLKEEVDHQDAKPDLAETASNVTKIEPPSPKNDRRAPAKPAVDPEKRRIARQQVIAWKLKVSTLNSEKQDAASRASYGGSQSVPGSLETWSARSERLGRELVRAQMGLSLAKSNLEAISPRDALLTSPEGQ